jgi:hypothetical protein
MAKTLEMAPEIVSFTDGDYFTGMCEVAAAQALKISLFIPTETWGIFQSLYLKRTFGRVQNADGSYTVGNFQMKNRYLYNYDRVSKSYVSVKEDNMKAFSAKVKALVDGTEEFKVFSKEKPAITIEDVLGF